MPTYDYRCDNNGKVLEVSHRMSDTVLVSNIEWKRRSKHPQRAF